MIDRRPRRAAPSPAILLALAAACTLAGGAVAEASCGDWLEGHSALHDRPEAAHRLPSAAFHHRPQLLRARLAAPAAGAMPLDRPCDGPACRRAPILPPAPVDAAEPPATAERAVPVGDAAGDVPDRVRTGPAGDDPPLSSAGPGRLERPPRHG